VSSDKLTRQQVDFVLRRAAEIDTHEPSSLARSAADANDGLTVLEVLRLGEEAGLESGSVSRALVELRRGRPDRARGGRASSRQPSGAAASS